MIILFDGVCNLCNGFVRFVIKRDRKNLFKFASLQSKYGIELLAKHHISSTLPQTVMVYDGERFFTQTEAVLKITGSLSGAWKATAIFLIIPAFIRDYLYRLVAKNRYKLFGKSKQCMVPTADMSDRFINDSL